MFPLFPFVAGFTTLSPRNDASVPKSISTVWASAGAVAAISASKAPAGIKRRDAFITDACIKRVLDHFWELGRREVDCLNTQNRKPEMDRCIDCFRSEDGWQGELLMDPKDSEFFEGESTSKPLKRVGRVPAASRAKP